LANGRIVFCSKKQEPNETDIDRQRGQDADCSRAPMPVSLDRELFCGSHRRWSLRLLLHALGQKTRERIRWFRLGKPKRPLARSHSRLSAANCCGRTYCQGATGLRAQRQPRVPGAMAKTCLSVSCSAYDHTAKPAANNRAVIKALSPRLPNDNRSPI